jgi:alpha-ketoglutaric semialdehyde dehydrogenase
MSSTRDLRNATCCFLTANGKVYFDNEVPGKEVFRLFGLVVRVADFDETTKIANSFVGQLTSTMHLDEDDTVKDRVLMPILEREADRCRG